MPTPLEVVQRQLDTYNARDVQGFAATFAHDCMGFDLDGASPFDAQQPEACSAGTIRFAGKAGLIARYGPQFVKYPKQFSTVVSRSVVGEYVFDLEFISGMPDRSDFHMMAVYRVRNGLIDRAWFTPRVPQ
jgi:putative hydrolase of HD superfamily